MKYNGYQTFISWIWCSFWKVVNISLGKHLVCGNLELLTNPENDWLLYLARSYGFCQLRIWGKSTESSSKIYSLSLSVTACLTSTSLIPLMSCKVSLTHCLIDQFVIVLFPDSSIHMYMYNKSYINSWWWALYFLF